MIFFLTKYERAFLQRCSVRSVNVGVHVYSVWSHLIGKADLDESVNFGSLGHVLSHSLSYFILQVRQFLPVCLQLQPLKVWHLKEDKKVEFENIFKELTSKYLLIASVCLREHNCKTFTVINLQTGFQFQVVKTSCCTANLRGK